MASVLASAQHGSTTSRSPPRHGEHAIGPGGYWVAAATTGPIISIEWFCGQ
jgi:hypothetical protein